MMQQNTIPDAHLALRGAPLQRNKAFSSLLPWYITFLFLILVLSAFLQFWQLGTQGYSNLYYAAGVKSMLTSWHNFFFVSFDSAGFVSLDKPPLGFWIQALSAKVFGFSPWSLMLPQALAGIASVALLAHLVRRTFGPQAALLAALALALFPISVITARNNDIDSLLVFVILCAAWCVTLAVERGRLRWLVLSMALVGLGFNIKALEAYLVLPALVLLYLCAASLPWRTRILHLLLALAVLLLISCAWITAVDLTPANQRPYVGSSSNNSEIDLAWRYNGLARVLGLAFLAPESSSPPASSSPSVNAFGQGETGAPGPLRLLNAQLGGQVSWLLPLAFAGLVAGCWRGRPRLRGNRQHQGILLWGAWFLVQVPFFSAIGYFHIYYMVMLAPSICALTGIALALLWQEYVRPGWRGWGLPVALPLTALLQVWLLSIFPDWNGWLSPLILGLTLLATLVLCAGRLLQLPPLRRLTRSALTLGSLALLLSSAAWAVLPIAQGSNTAFPVAGPTPHQDQLARMLAQVNEIAVHPDPLLISYLLRHQGKARYLLGTSYGLAAAPFILATGRPVMALGGYQGYDQIVTPDQMIALIHSGAIRYFYLSTAQNFDRLPVALITYLQEARSQAASPGPSPSLTNLQIIGWLTAFCTPVPPDQWRPGYVQADDVIEADNLFTLFDCQGVQIP